MDHYSFSGKNVLVTGASGGLGSALVRGLADQGAGLIVTSRSQKALDQLITLLPGHTRVIPVTADLSLKGEAENLARRAIELAGYVDVLINNAGVGYFALMAEATEENIRHLFEVNAFSPLMLMKFLMPHMIERGGGRIVNIVSTAGRIPLPSVGVYGGSKSALAVMANTMRLEAAPFGIDIINIYPGTIRSSFEENALREEARPGLCPTDSCGLPKVDIALQVLKAASGPPGEIWLEREGRRLAAMSLVWPAYVDRKLTPVRNRVVHRRSLKKCRWRLVQLESAMACNLRCIMCPWKDFRKTVSHRGLMTREIWAAVRPYLTDIQSIDFTGGGEPLLQPDLPAWVAEAKKAGCETGILTNGVLLTCDMSDQLLDAGLDWLCVSLDGADREVYESIRVGSDFDLVGKNLAYLAANRRGGVPKIMINFVIMSVNRHQISDMVRLAARLGADQVNFKQCDVIRGSHGKGLGVFAGTETRDTRRLKKELSQAMKLAKTLNVKTTGFSFTPTQQPVCDQDPRHSLFVRYDGWVSPCINLAIGGPTTFLGREVEMPTIHYGRLPDQDLADIWQTETARFYQTRFEQRFIAHEDTMIKSLTGGFHPSPRRLAETALENMPEAPEGCRVCHYLYDI